ncbi:CocE/NonD family hydrolase [Euzebya sp.]|uniref:CocE/NonD family hydrolase n=1 Tax=Euzebya sp. TaxID=1971409 RepID=UPI0035183561
MRAVAVLVVLAVLVLPGPAGAQLPTPGEGEGGEVRDAVVTGVEDTPIVTDLHLPAGASADAPVPVVLSGHGWGATRDTALGSTTDLLLAQGYAVVVWDARGFGQSGGTVQVDAPEFEGQDVSAILDWLATQPEIALDGPGDPVVGMVGNSYGGGIQLATATFDARVDALAPQITWHDLNRALQPQGVLKLVWQLLLFGLGGATGTIVGLDPSGPAFPQTGTVPPELADALTQALTANAFDEELTQFFAARSFSDYGPSGQLDVPTLLFQGSVDTLFTIDEAVDTFTHLRDTGVPTKLVVFCGSLTDAATGGAITHGQCPSFYADAGDQPRIDDMVLRWFDRHLRDLPVDTGPPVEYRTNTGDWHRADTWPPPGTDTLTVPVEGTALTTNTPGSGLGILALPAVPGSPTAVTVEADAPELAGRQVEVVGQPVARLSATGTGLGAHLYAKLIDSTQGELPAGGSAVNNQETPMRLDALSADPQVLDQPMVGAAYTYAPDAPVTVQVDTQSLMYTFPRTGPAQIDLTGEMTIPYRTLVTDRIGGPDRIGTAAELSRDSVLAADTVVIATSTDYPDALAGAPLATSLGAPLLLTGPDALADQARREILRTGATTAVLLGGEAVIGAGVEEDLGALGLTVERVAGPDRFATAAAIAGRLDSTTAYLVEGIDADPARGWPDAVSAAAPAAEGGAPVLLTDTDVLPEATLDALAAGGVTDVVIVGGPAAVSSAVEAHVVDAGYAVTRLGGADRFATSAAVAGLTPGARTVVAATGGDWPDALAAASAAAAWDAALVLVDGVDATRSAATHEFVQTTAFDRLVLAGLTAAVGEGAAAQLTEAADAGTPPAAAAVDPPPEL